MLNKKDGVSLVILVVALVLILFLQAMITYAESLLLRKEIKGENGKQI
ncbi:hypothetical protein [Paenibacillus sp. IHBB 3054]